MSSRFSRGIIKKYNTFSYSSSATHELSIEQCGSIIFIDASSNDITFKLPKVANNAGAHYKFVNTTVPNGSGTEALVFNQNESSGANLVKLSDSTTRNEQKVNIVICEYIECACDGSKWYILTHHKT